MKHLDEMEIKAEIDAITKKIDKIIEKVESSEAIRPNQQEQTNNDDPSV